MAAPSNVGSAISATATPLLILICTLLTADTGKAFSASRCSNDRRPTGRASLVVSSPSSSRLCASPSSRDDPPLSSQRHIVSPWSNFGVTATPAPSSLRLSASTSGDEEGGGDAVATADVAAARPVEEDGDASSEKEKVLEQNTKYIEGLLESLQVVVDKWIVTGTMASRRRAYNIIQQVGRLAMDEELGKKAIRLAKRAGMPLDEPPPVPPTEHVPATEQPKQDTSCGGGVTMDTGMGSMRNEFATARSAFDKNHADNNKEAGGQSGEAAAAAVGTEALGKNLEERIGGLADDGAEKLNGNTDPFPFQSSLEPITSFAADKESMQGEMADAPKAPPTSADGLTTSKSEARSSELVAAAGSGRAFEGETLGVGGLDDVLAQIKRRVWIPLAAPPSLLVELGINPVRGLLLYGQPGCGKTLLARKLGGILSPARPISIVSGPSILDKFVGSSEKNVREIFDNPPDLHFQFKKNYPELANTALHVIVLDEFDAIARNRGGNGGKGDQGDAGVARDSVVNQILAKMDGVDDLGVPTLLIGLTNKRTLIDQALLRPGRFEVQIEVPPPKTVPQRVSILKVHMANMYRCGRVLVRDAPVKTAASRRIEREGRGDILSFEELLDLLAIETDGMSGASLAGVTRAAASRALERAVTDFAGSGAGAAFSSDDDDDDDRGKSISDCLVTQSDFEKAIEDVFESARGGDGGE